MAGTSELTGWWRLALATVEPILRAAFRLRFAGTANIPETGAGIIASNHVSVLDPIVVALAPALQGRKLHFLAAAELFGIPVVGWGLRTMEQIPIRRGESDAEALEATAAIIRAGRLAGIFPEGRVNPGPELLPGHRGAARLAIASGAPIIPAAIWGTNTRWPKGGLTLRRPLRAPVTVVFGKPIEVAAADQSREGIRELTDRVMAAIEELRAKARSLAG